MTGGHIWKRLLKEMIDILKQDSLEIKILNIKLNIWQLVIKGP